MLTTIDNQPASGQLSRNSLLLLMLVLALLAFGYIFHEDVIAAQSHLMQWMGEQPVLGPATFVALYALSVPLLIPSLPLMLAAGMLFGFGPGVALAFVANTLGGVLAFLLARSNLRDFVRKQIRDNDTFVAFDDAIRDDGLRTALLIRMSPVLPGWLINYGLGLTALRFRHYLLAAFGAIPVLLVYVSIGTTVHAISDLFVAHEADQQMNAMKLAAMIVFILSALAVTQLIKRRAFRSLERRRSANRQEDLT